MRGIRNLGLLSGMDKVLSLLNVRNDRTIGFQEAAREGGR